MSLGDNIKKIRRFLRDPNSKIFTTGLLVRSWNDVQFDLIQSVGMNEKVMAIRVPAQYEISYQNDWEWQHLTGQKSYQAFFYHHQSGYVCCNNWETQLWGTSSSETDQGYAFTHPFEAYNRNTNRLPPVWFPYDFHKAIMVAWDKEPIDHITTKNVQSNDQSWKIQSGTPFAYYREDITSNEFYLYPKPDAPVFEDILGDADPGNVLFTSEDTEDSELGIIIDMPEYTPDSNNGLVIDVVDTDDNILMIYESGAVEMEGVREEPDYPKFIQKYIEYGVLRRAYSANTDGRIESLRDYWNWRYELGIELLKKFKWKRMQDRDFRLTSKEGEARRRHRGPRLPDAYPYVR